MRTRKKRGNLFIDRNASFIFHSSVMPGKHFAQLFVRYSSECGRGRANSERYYAN